MSTPLIIGQDNVLSVQIDSVVYQSLAITSSEITYKLSRKETGILGTNTMRIDEVFVGIEGSLEVKIGDPDMFQIINIIRDRAQRRAPPYPRVTLKSEFTFPADNRRALIVIPDLKFGDIPITTGAREEHATIKLSYGAEQAPIYFI